MLRVLPTHLQSAFDAAQMFPLNHRCLKRRSDQVHVILSLTFLPNFNLRITFAESNSQEFCLDTRLSFIIHM